jgi:hypothetical protein
MPSRIARTAGLLAAVAALATLPACPDSPDPKPTGSTCPPGSPLTYDNFAAPFMAAYCTRCHASTLSGPERHGAPLFHDFDSERGILNVGHHVDEYAAAGPLAINTIMPNDDGAAPTVDERRHVGVWLAGALGARDTPDAGVDAAPHAATDATPDAPPDAP